MISQDLNLPPWQKEKLSQCIDLLNTRLEKLRHSNKMWDKGYEIGISQCLGLMRIAMQEDYYKEQAKQGEK